MRALKDFYVMAYEFYKKVNRKGSVEDASLYALFMPATWLGFIVLIGISVGSKVFGAGFGKLLDAPRIVLDVEALALIGGSAIAMWSLLRGSPDISSPEVIRKRYEELSFGRKCVILSVVLATPVVFALM